MYLARKNPLTVEEADKSIKSGEETDKSQESAPTDLNGFELHNGFILHSMAFTGHSPALYSTMAGFWAQKTSI